MNTNKIIHKYNIQITTNISNIENPTKIIISNLYEGNNIFKEKTEIVTSGNSVWNNFLRNIPNQLKINGTNPGNTIISLTKNKEIGPILVLVELKYKGNIGSIIRSAVQSNIFESIIIITSKNRDISNQNIKYYSVMNSPLIPIIKLNNINDFIKNLDQNRKLISMNIHPNSINIYENMAKQILKCDNSYIIMGSEDMGIPIEIQEKTNYHVEIPHLSSCINVSCAFMVILTIMNLERYQK